MKTADTRRMQTTEMRKIRMTCGKILYGVVREWTDVGDINKQPRGHRLRWLGYLEHLKVVGFTRRVREKTMVRSVRRERPKKTWKEKDDMKRHLALKNVQD